ncbi:uncharacterized protein LOC142983156 [Anticarsia gemmatalis]|uniref:uncharacterized protein LOC142983156 n=1 Tax=Anticarsia gemmatalis TaxID=129554 RepID=UPI003F75DEF5
MSLEVNISEPDEFNCQELHSSIKEVAKKKGVDDFEYNVECISGKGSNYIANVFRVLIKETNSAENKFSVIVKTLVNTERQVLFHELHKREVIAYNNVINKFNNIQSVLEEGVRLLLPECLYATVEQMNEVIILDDLQSKGFEIDDKLAKFEYLSFEQVSTVISELAKFHAMSFIAQKHDSENFDRVAAEFHDILYQNQFLNKSKLRNYIFESFDMSLKLVENKDAKKKLKKVKEHILELLQAYAKPGKTNVLCHGDCWVNNMLFKYEENEKIKICFIDYQAMRFANPMTDILYFLLICTDSKFRSEHLDQLKDIYHDSLKSFLRLFDIDVNFVYTKDNFISDFEEFLPYGVLAAMIELRIVTMDPEEDATLKRAKLTSNWDLSQVPDESMLFRHRVNDLVNEAVENGALEKLLEKINN